MQTYSIEISERKRYLDPEIVGPKTLRDSRGTTRTIWPVTFDVPTDFLVHVERGCLQWVELSYLTDHGQAVEHRMDGLGSFSFFLYHGLLSVVRPDPAPETRAGYDAFLTITERLLEFTRFQSDLAPGKWKAIFSARLLREQWIEGETFLRRLLEQRPHPYR